MTNCMVNRNGRAYRVSYEFSVVTIRQATHLGEGDFDAALSEIDSMLRLFTASEPGTIWGCDGVGYLIEKAQGIAFRHKSGVGPRNFRRGLEWLSRQGEEACLTGHTKGMPK